MTGRYKLNLTLKQVKQIIKRCNKKSIIDKAIIKLLTNKIKYYEQWDRMIKGFKR